MHLFAGILTAAILAALLPYIAVKGIRAEDPRPEIVLPLMAAFAVAAVVFAVT